MSASPLLEVRDLRTHIDTPNGTLRAVDGVSFSVDAGDTLGIVGESGCGKSITALSLMRLLPAKIARIAGGSIRLEGEDLLGLSPERMRRIRGNRMAMIFQEPMTSLNPVLTIGDQIAESVMLHRGLSRAAALERATEMLRLVRMPDAEARLHSYPHQFSGGMRQRVMIAMALSCDPRLLIADEPTTALDVTIQAQILSLMVDIKERLGTAVLLITHDLGVVAETCQRVMVMYAGRKAEEAPVNLLFERPLHPYTRALLGSMPGLQRGRRQRRLDEIPGMVPSLTLPQPGCPFADRCPLATDRCRTQMPPMRDFGGGQQVACWEAEVELAA